MRLIGMRVLLTVLLASCGSPHATPIPETPPPPAPADARTAAIDAGEVLHDAAVARPASQLITPSPRNPACPPPPTGPAGPRHTSPLETWRSRAELPACLAPWIPADVDFDREMLVAELPATLRQIELKPPASTPIRDGASLIIEEQMPSECRPCSGVVQPLPPPRPAPPTIVWRIRREVGVATFLRMRAPRACPPCMAP